MESSEIDKKMEETDRENQTSTETKVDETNSEKQTSNDHEIDSEKESSTDTKSIESDSEKQTSVDNKIDEPDSVNVTSNDTKIAEINSAKQTSENTKIAETADCENQTSNSPFAIFHKLMGPKLFTLHATLIIALRTTCYGYFSGILTTLERRFQLSSSEAGSLIIINDISELCFIVIASHFGHKSHRPRWIAIGSVTMGIGMLICAIPHFSMPALDPEAVQLGIYRGLSYGDEGSTLDSSGLCKQRLRNDVSGELRLFLE